MGLVLLCEIPIMKDGWGRADYGIAGVVCVGVAYGAGSASGWLSQKVMEILLKALALV